MNHNHSTELREQLLQALQGGNSHLDFEATVADFPLDSLAKKPYRVPHSAWQLLEHLRIAQHDILEFSRNPGHKSPSWPEGYWPDSEAPPLASSWGESIAAFKQDADELEELISDSEQDLFAVIAGGDGQTLLREAIVVSMHNSYHLGQLMFLKKMLLAGS